MPKTTIVLQKCEDPNIDATGKKFGAKIWDTAGTKYSPSKLYSMFKGKEGGTFEIFYEDRNYQGNPFKAIEHATLVSEPTASGAAPAPIERARTPQHDADRMWTCALLEAAIQAGQLDSSVLTDVVERGRLFLEAQQYIFSNKQLPAEKANGPTPPKTELSKEMNDEIPF